MNSEPRDGVRRSSARAVAADAIEIPLDVALHTDRWMLQRAISVRDAYPLVFLVFEPTRDGETVQARLDLHKGRIIDVLPDGVAMSDEQQRKLARHLAGEIQRRSSGS